MKSIKLILIISATFFIFKFNNIQAQQIENGTKYLFVGSFSGTKKIDSLTIIKQTIDSIIFERITPEKWIGKQTFIKTNNVISIIENNKIIPMYDYNLQIGDSFNLNVGDSTNFKIITLYLDSVKNITLLDSKIYKHWYLHSNTLYNKQAVWIENIGEISIGWDYRNIFDIETTYQLYLICKNNTLTFVRGNLPPTCNFDSILRSNINKVLSKPQLIIYPNPACEKLFIENNGTQSSNYFITNLLGKEKDKGVLKSEIEISHLLNGVYVLKIVSTNNQTQVLKFIKL